MNGYNDIVTEPGEDEDFAVACGFEVIHDEDLFSMLSLSCRQIQPQESSSRKSGLGKRLLSKKDSVASIASTSSSSSWASPLIRFKKPSSASLSSQMTDEGYSSAECGGVSDAAQDADDRKNLWYMIQKKRSLHHRDAEYEMRMSQHPYMTLEQTSNNHKKLTDWLHNIIHFPEKIRQISADKQRFSIDKASKEIRDELKHIYVY